VSDVSCREDYGHAGRRVGPRSVQVPIHALRTQGEEGRIEGREGDAGREAGRRKGRGSGAGVGMGGGGLGALGGGQGVGAIRARTRTLAPLHTCARLPPPCVSTATPTRLVGGRTCHEEDTHEECGERRPGWRGGGGSRGVEDHVGTLPATLRTCGNAEALGGAGAHTMGRTHTRSVRSGGQGGTAVEDGHTTGGGDGAPRVQPTLPRGGRREVGTANAGQPTRNWYACATAHAVAAPHEHSPRWLEGVVGTLLL
jgi:hypothetical protein